MIFTGLPLVILIDSTVSKYPKIRKYKLAIFENYSIIFKGINVQNQYFDVVMVLSGSSLSGTLVIIYRSISILNILNYLASFSSWFDDGSNKFLQLQLYYYIILHVSLIFKVLLIQLFLLLTKEEILDKKFQNHQIKEKEVNVMDAMMVRNLPHSFLQELNSFSKKRIIIIMNKKFLYIIMFLKPGFHII